MSAHGFRTIGVLGMYIIKAYVSVIKLITGLGAGQMGLGIAYVASLRARVPVLLVDRSPVQIQKSLSLMDKLLAKDVSKGKISEQEAKDARARITVVPQDVGISGLKEADLVVEVCLLCYSCINHDIIPRLPRRMLT